MVGHTPANPLLLFSSEENDQFAGANVGRAVEPQPAGCDGVTAPPCQYLAGSIGELQANIKGLLAATASASTPFDVEPQGASIYVKGQPAANDPIVRQLERDTAAMIGDDAYSGVKGETIIKYQAGALEQRVLHMQTADPLRTPTYTLFPKGDYFFATSGPNVSFNTSFAYDHGYYSPNIDVTWVAFVGPGVAVGGVDGPQPADYQSDGHVITQALTSVSPALASTAALAAGYDQINSSVGQFATDTLIADTKALASGSSADDTAYLAEQTALKELADDRDAVAADIKVLLSNAAAARHRKTKARS